MQNFSDWTWLLHQNLFPQQPTTMNLSTLYSPSHLLPQSPPFIFRLSNLNLRAQAFELLKGYYHSSLHLSYSHNYDRIPGPGFHRLDLLGSPNGYCFFSSYLELRKIKRKKYYLWIMISCGPIGGMRIHSFSHLLIRNQLILKQCCLLSSSSRMLWGRSNNPN